MKPGYVVALVILALSLAGVLFSFGGAVAQHVDVPQALAREGQTVQVPGRILKDTVSYDANAGVLRFMVEDMQDPGHRMTVVYAQPKPENFDTATSVEAIGRYENGVFKAHNLLVKCPSKYSDEKTRTAAE